MYLWWLPWHKALTEHMNLLIVGTYFILCPHLSSFYVSQSMPQLYRATYYIFLNVSCSLSLPNLYVTAPLSEISSFFYQDNFPLKSNLLYKCSIVSGDPWSQLHFFCVPVAVAMHTACVAFLGYFRASKSLTK